MNLPCCASKFATGVAVIVVFVLAFSHCGSAQAQIFGPGPRELRDEHNRANLTRTDGARPQLADYAYVLGSEKTDRATDAIDWIDLNKLKRQFTLFNPTPNELLREFLTDRPDKTLTPVTVDAGHVQFETDFVTYKFEREQQPQEQGLKDRRFYSFMLTNVRIGVTNNSDFHIVLQPFDYIDGTAPRSSATTDQGTAFGFGDMSLMLKHNVWGNDGGATALGWSGRIDLPSGSPAITSGYVEGGGAIFWLRRWPNKVYLGLEVGVDARENVRRLGYHAEFLNSASFAFGLTKRLSTKFELASVASTEPKQPWEGIFATALLYQPQENVQLDLGINVGLTRPAADINPYLGFSIRL